MLGLARSAGVLALLTLLVGPSSSWPEEPDSKPILVHVEDFRAGDPQIEQEELHLIARELFVNALAASRKFVFAGDRGAEGVQLVLGGTLARESGQYYFFVRMKRADGSVEALPLESSVSLEDLITHAAEAVSKLEKRTGYVIKREGDRIVIARGSEDGIAVGQRYRTTDTFEEFVIIHVSAHTAEGKIVGVSTLPAAPAPGRTSIRSLPSSGASVGDSELGAVDIVFVIDTTGSMQQEIDGVLANCERFADRLAAKGIDAYLGLVTFRVGVKKVRGLTPSVAEFKSWVEPLRAGSGGRETPFEALERALAFGDFFLPLGRQGLGFRPDAKRIFVLITDEPAYDAIDDAVTGVSRGCGASLSRLARPRLRDVRVRNQLRHRKRITLSQIMASGIAHRVIQELHDTKTVVYSVTVDDDKGIYLHLARQTGGAFYDLERNQDFSTLLDTIGHKIEGMFVEM